MVISERLRRLAKVAMIAGFGLVVFLVVLYLTLPYGRFKDLLAAQVSTYGYEMEARQAGPSLGLGMTLREVSLVSRPAGGGKPTRILIDKAKFGVSLLSYLFGNKSVSATLKVFGGEIDSNVKIGKTDSSIDASVTEIDLAEIPWVKNLINLPLAGKMDVSLNLALPKQRLSEAKGSLGWECSACALGDGKAKLVIAGNPMLAEGLGLPKIRLGDFTGKVPIDKGVARMQSVQFKSQDLEATIEGEIHLAQPVPSSRVDLYVRFKLSDSLLRSSEKLRMIMDLTAQMGKRPDGFIGFRMSGTFQNMSSFQWLKTSPFVSAVTPTPGKPAPRPAAPAPPPPVPAPTPPPPPTPAVPPPPPPAPAIAQAPVTPPPAPAPAPPPPTPVPPPPAAPPPPPAPPATAPAAPAPAATTTAPAPPPTGSPAPPPGPPGAGPTAPAPPPPPAPPGAAAPPPAPPAETPPVR